MRIRTDAGHTGFGEACTTYGHFYPTVVKTIVDDILSPVLIEKDPLSIRDRVREMGRYLHPWMGWDGITSQVIAAIEIALWDIKGKELKKPIHDLLGGKAVDSIPLYIEAVPKI